MKDTPQEVLKDTPQKVLDKSTKNTLGAAIVAASLASTFAETPSFRYKCHPIFDRCYERFVPTPLEHQRNLDAQQEAILKAKAKRERKAQQKEHTRSVWYMKQILAKPTILSPS